MLSISDVRAVLAPIWQVAFQARDFVTCAVVEAILRAMQRGSIAVGMGLTAMTAEELTSFARALAILGPRTTYDAEQLIKVIFTSPAPGTDRPIAPAPGEVYFSCEGDRVVLSRETPGTYPSRPVTATNSMDLEPLACLTLTHLLGIVPVTGRYRCPPFLAQAAQFPPSPSAADVPGELSHLPTGQ